MEDRFHAEASRRLEEKWRQVGSWEAVARDVRRKVRDAPTSLDAERLARIANLEIDSRPSWEECTCLLKCLFGLFASQPLLEALQQQGTSLVFLASNQDSPTTSRWDADARFALLPDLPQASLEYVPLLGPDEFLRAKPDWFRAPWASGWSNGRRISRLAFGSPKGCHGAEVVLASIFEVPPFTPPGTSGTPPALFLWPRADLEASVPSSFAQAIDQVPFPWDVEVMDGWRPRGLAVRTDPTSSVRRVFPITRDPGKDHDYGTDYALVAARREPSGAVLAACAGISGPATCAAARCLKEFSFPEGCDLIYGVVRAAITFLNRTSDRKLDSCEVVWTSYSNEEG